MGKRKRGTPLGDRTRRRYALPIVERKQRAAEREALAKMPAEVREANLRRVAQIQALLGDEA